MAVKITYFAHGADADEDREISSGWNDPELSEVGRQQAFALQYKIKDRNFDIVFTSDQKRAYDTARLAFGNTARIIPDERLRECNYGKLNGAPKKIVEPMQEAECIYSKFPEGESYEDVKIRVSDFLQFLKKNYEGKNVAVITHKAPQLAFEVLLNGKSWEEAIRTDWRKTKSWQPGWEYVINY